MKQLQRTDLYSLENYAVIRDAFRAEVMAHKKLRNIQLGENLTEGLGAGAGGVALRGGRSG